MDTRVIKPSSKGRSRITTGEKPHSYRRQRVGENSIRRPTNYRMRRAPDNLIKEEPSTGGVGEGLISCNKISRENISGCRGPHWHGAWDGGGGVCASTLQLAGRGSAAVDLNDGNSAGIDLRSSVGEFVVLLFSSVGTGIEGAL